MGPWFCWEVESRFLLRCKLDVAYFHLYLSLPSELDTDSHHSPATLGNIRMNETNSNYEECYVAFLDLMGVRRLVKACETDGQRYQKVITALRETSDISAFKSSTRDLNTGELKNWKLQVQAFSDCVVLFIPTETRALSWILASVRRLNDKLLRLEIPVRGGITIGGMHWDAAWSNSEKNSEPATPLAFGPGLVEAYTLEDETAVYPRILMSNKLVDYIRDNNLKSFPFSSYPLKIFCRQDMDGLFHLDLLHEHVNRKDVTDRITQQDKHGHQSVRYVFDETLFVEWLQQVRTFILEQLQKVNGEKLKSKYLWLARYHNATVRRFDKGSKITIFEDEIP